MSSLIQDFFTIKNNNYAKGKLDLTDEDDIIIDEVDMRLEKIIKLLEKIKK